MDHNIAQARKIWENIKKRKSQSTTILTQKREQELINKIRRDRERIWEEKMKNPSRFGGLRRDYLRKRGTMRKDVQKARKALERARELSARGPSPFKDMSMPQVIHKLRETREELWREKIENSTRHQ